MMVMDEGFGEALGEVVFGAGMVSTGSVYLSR